MTQSADASGRAEIDFDPARLRAWLDEVMPDTRGSLEIERIGGGQSNPTYFVTAGSRRMVLRKQPPGELLKSAHDMGREFKIISSLYGTPVPVPEPILYHDRSDVVGKPFYLMGRLDGPVFYNCALPTVPVPERRDYYRAFARTLADLHAVDWQATELASFARPGSFVTRQVERWARSWTTQDPQVIEVANWLRAHLPPEESVAIVHGDYKFTNMVFAPDEPRILGVLDWELCTIGDPLTDIGHIYAFQWQSRTEEYGGLLGQDVEVLGVASFAEFVQDYYAVAQNARPLTRFYLVLGLFRAAGIMRGIGDRAVSGSASAPDAEEKGKLDKVFLGRALETIDADLPL